MFLAIATSPLTRAQPVPPPSNPAAALFLRRQCGAAPGRTEDLRELLAELDGYATGSNLLVRPPDFGNRTCPYCRNQFEPSRSHPHQLVCSSAECQRRRRADYHRKKLAKDPLYHALCEDSQKTWKQRNPDYMKQYRASHRKVKPGRPAVRPRIAEIKRLLTSLRNNLVKNTSALLVTRSAPGIWVIAPKKMAGDKNTLAPTHVIVIQGLKLSE
jgi:hypothetical protein